MNNNIICERCKKPANITAEGGKFCLKCWRLNRKEKRDIRIQESLNTCFGYKSSKKFTEHEAKLLNEIMEEINSKRKVYK